MRKFNFSRSNNHDTSYGHSEKHIVGEEYLWSGEQLFEAAPIYADGTVPFEHTTRWSYASGGITPLAQQQGDTLWYVVTDHLGTPRWVVAERSNNPPPHIAQTKKVKPQVPTFTINGVELRGGERFLIILPSGSSTLGEATLLRQGESTARWRLDAIHGLTAVLLNLMKPGCSVMILRPTRNQCHQAQHRFSVLNPCRPTQNFQV